MVSNNDLTDPIHHEKTSLFLYHAVQAPHYHFEHRVVQ